MRDHINLLCTNLSIHGFKMPNMTALVQRYVTELCLPQDIAIYAERLINFLPPRCAVRTKHFLPNYEARAMAYIIFILKLLFGLDGEKEHRMSRAAKKLNRKIQNINRQKDENRPLLFVWNEWVQYIEMRKIIVSHFNQSFSRQFKQCESATQIMEQMSKGIRKRNEEQQTQVDHVENLYYKQQFETFRSLLNTLLEQHPNATDSSSATSMEFKPTFTPGYSYFKTILLHCDNANIPDSSDSVNGPSFKIPEFMRVDHAERDINSYVEVKHLIEYFQNNQTKLNVYKLDTTENRCFAGIFRSTRAGSTFYPTQEPNFNISEEEWKVKIQNRVSVGTDDLDWKTEFEPYGEKYLNHRLRRMLRTDNQRGSSLDEEEENANVSIQHLI